MKKNNYSEITSLKELRSERERIAWRKEIIARKMDVDIERIKRIFSFENLLMIVNEKLEMIRSLARGAHGIIDYIVSLFRHNHKEADEHTIETTTETQKGAENSQEAQTTEATEAQ